MAKDKQDTEYQCQTGWKSASSKSSARREIARCTEYQKPLTDWEEFSVFIRTDSATAPKGFEAFAVKDGNPSLDDAFISCKRTL